jgi:hypothetical protein
MRHVRGTMPMPPSANLLQKHWLPPFQQLMRAMGALLRLQVWMEGVQQQAKVRSSFSYSSYYSVLQYVMLCCVIVCIMNLVMLHYDIFTNDVLFLNILYYSMLCSCRMFAASTCFDGSTSGVARGSYLRLCWVRHCLA